ncbi:MAG: hypothetical protein ACYC3S_18450 [Chloroflexota bacterium]
MTENIYDITIGGGGSVGLYGLYYAGLRDMKAKVVEAMPQLGGQLAALCPRSTSTTSRAFPGCWRRNSSPTMEEQALQNRPAVCAGERVLNLTRREDGVLTLTTDRARHFVDSTSAVEPGHGTFRVAPRGAL